MLIITRTSVAVVRYTLIALFVLYSGWVIIREEGGDEYRRELLMASSLDEKLYDQIEQHKIATDVLFDGISTSEWCLEPSEPPIPYDRCRYDDKYSILFQFGVYGGLTNALHFILKGAIWAMEEGVCFYVSENGKQVSKLAYREPPQKTVSPFLERYFEPIGLPESSNKVQDAIKAHQVFEPHYHMIQHHEYGKRSGGNQVIDYPDRHKTRNLDFLNLWEKDNIWLKKHVMRRLFRIKPQPREIACSRLKDHGLNDKYMALSVRRGDKSLEYEVESDLQVYIDKAEDAIKTHFDGKVPTIFVASDDCSVMKELRALRNDFNFVSECDKVDSHGFIISEMKHWTLKETDDHYHKFITELIAMATAHYWIGVSTTNVAYFVYFMRHYDMGDDSWVFVDSDRFPH